MKLAAPTKDYLDAVRQQDNAANPQRDVFVSANAGSGKTHVLVNRVSRLLLSNGGLEPDKILCLTYTKAAASEMQTRLFDTLGKWSIMDAAELREKLDKLLGKEESQRVDLRLARRLFAKALETPEGLKVQTIHAFCERLLSRFPVEAGILPGFDALDDNDAKALQAEVWQDILKLAHENPESETTWALTELMRTNANATIEGLRSWMGYNIYKIIGWEAAGGTAPLADMLGVDAQTSEDAVRREAWAGVNKTALQAAAQGMAASGSKKYEAYAKTLLDALKAANSQQAYRLYESVVLNKSGAPNSQVATGACGEEALSYFGKYNKIETPAMFDVAEAIDKFNSVKILTATRAVFEISREFAARYRRLKSERRLLDFADQIMLTRNLLKESHVSDWVSYKLDGGIEHILVDEAQDTSQAQWDIVDVIRNMFKQDQIRDARFPRTMFAVGDEKQSIYSFQGADPELFIGRTKDEEENSKYSGIRMRMSFRSAPDILRFVDQIFVDERGMEKMFSADFAPQASDLIRHTANRSVAGLIELWPLAPAPISDHQELPWKPDPVDSESEDSAREALAREIAKQIKLWLETKEAVTVRGKDGEVTRPMQPKDILILVRKRTGAFFNAVIRNLKWQGVPVAGADRLVLSESIAVQDLMSIARFCCLPGDDLALAEVLKGPLFGISEEQLFDLAYEEGGRKSRLWSALKFHKAAWAIDAAERLTKIIKMSRIRAPYEFFEGVLSTPTLAGESQLRLFYKRLSMEVADPIDAFLARALAHQRNEAPSLQHFIQSFMSDTAELKREFDGRHNEVRVMTVYGAKGLEAPVVILPDTSQKPDGKGVLDNGMLALADGTFVRPGPSAQTPEILENVKTARKAKLYQEYMRLFYVALTRAETRLLICGYFTGRPPEEGAAQKAADGCWHDLAQQALMGLGAQEIDTPFTSDAYAGYAYGQRPKNIMTIEAESESRAVDLPRWAVCAEPPSAPASGARYVTPSTLLSGEAGLEPPARSPLSQTADRFMRGNLIHKLLELLPDVKIEMRTEALERFLSGHDQLTPEQRSDISLTVMRVLEHPEFAEIFAPASRAEISLAGRAKGLPDDLLLNAQIDRLAVTDDKVFVVDYKSNRPPPRRAQDVSDLYLGQMAAYREMARTAFEGRKVVCGLLWTERADMMILPDELLDQAIEKIKRQSQ